MSGYHFESGHRTYTASADIVEHLQAYVKHGQPTGGFLQACLENDLKGAVMRADVFNLPNIPAIVSYLYNEVPADCWGSPAKVSKWLDGGWVQYRRNMGLTD